MKAYGPGPPTVERFLPSSHELSQSVRLMIARHRARTGSAGVPRWATRSRSRPRIRTPPRLGLSELGLSELGLSELGLSELGLSELRLPAEALIRLVYGRLDEAHTPPAETAGVELDELRQIFRGF